MWAAVPTFVAAAEMSCRLVKPAVLFELSPSFSAIGIRASVAVGDGGTTGFVVFAAVAGRRPPYCWRDDKCWRITVRRELT
jgi:hypothetical protein